MVQFIQKHIGCAEALDLPPPQCLQKKIVLVAAAALIDADGRVLMAQRPVGKPMAGLWEFPGGKVQEGETPEFALMRELEEELGLTTRPCCFSPIAFASHAYEDFHLLMPLFACRVWKGIVQAREGQAFKWLKPVEMFGLPMPEADVPLVAQLQAVL
jgi:8-oxo-dGTP diphosphatase